MHSILKHPSTVSSLVIVGSFLIASVALASIVAGLSTTGLSNDVAYTELTLTKPSGTVAGDFLLANVSVNGGSVAGITAPSGWALVARVDNDTNISIASYWKTVGASEPTSYTWTISPQTRAAGGITRYSGVDPTNPIAAATSSVGVGAVASAPSITTTDNGARIVALFAINAGKANNPLFSTTTGMTKQYDIRNIPYGPTASTQDKAQISAGATGVASSSVSQGEQRNWAAQQIALRPSGDLQNGLISYWKLDESSGNASDSKGSNTLTNNNSATFTLGKIGNSANLVHDNQQYFSISDNSQTGLDITGDMTINTWINLAAPLGGVVGFVSKCDNVSRSWCSLFSHNGSSDVFNLTVSADGGGGSDPVPSLVLFPSPLSPGVWYMITVVYNSGTGSYNLYRDGVLQGTGTGLPNSIFNGTAEFRVGWDNNPSPTDGFNGKMDEVGIWNRALTISEITALYNGGAGLQYPF
ncbi:MAG: exported protein of unknown function [Parcubacteria group bacterium Gr01-1014_56]|nr:MAG: exported protein of unknown function [Parcubacteria group bacterium Gr01-1014_56]